MARHPDGKSAHSLEFTGLQSPPCGNVKYHCVCCAERDEHDARDQRPLLADEGQPSVVDPESLPVQRSDTAHLSLSSLHSPVCQTD